MAQGFRFDHRQAGHTRQLQRPFQQRLGSEGLAQEYEGIAPLVAGKGFEAGVAELLCQGNRLGHELRTLFCQPATVQQTCLLDPQPAYKAA